MAPAPPILAIIFWNLPIFFINFCISPKRMRRLFSAETVVPLQVAMVESSDIDPFRRNLEAQMF